MRRYQNKLVQDLTSDSTKQVYNHQYQNHRLTDYERESLAEDVDWKDVEVFIDGPYGAPAVDIFETEHAVLIAAGIGNSI